MSEFTKLPMAAFFPQAATNSFQLWAKAFTAAEPFTRHVMRANLEAVGFVGQRLRAYHDLSNEITRCRKPQDVVDLQMRFWQRTAQDYQAAGEKIGEAWRAALTPLAGQAGDEPKAPRDYITFPDAAAPQQPDAAPSRKRAA